MNVLKENYEHKDVSIEDVKYDTKNKLSNLEKDISKDLEKFEKLANDKDVQIWAIKIFEKSCNDVMAKDFEKMKNIDVKDFLHNISKKYKDLRFYVSWELQLPLSVANFSNLTTNQKLNFLALYETMNVGKDESFRWKLKDLWWKKVNNSAEIIKSCNNRLDWYYKDINKWFKKINNLNFWNIKNTLIKDFGLTETETTKYKEYILLIKKHPEYIWIIKPQEAGKWWLVITWIVIWVILWALWYHFVDNFGKWDGQTEIRKSKIEISDPENILRLLTQESDFIASDIAEKPLFQIQEDDGIVKELGKKIINRAETKKVEMIVEWKLALQYDAGKYLKMEVDKDTWMISMYVCPPDVVVTQANAKITNKKNEFVNLSHFDQVELELLDSIKQDAINDAKRDPNFLSKAQQQTYDMLLPLFQSLHPYGVDIRWLEVIYVDNNWKPLNQWLVKN